MDLNWQAQTKERLWMAKEIVSVILTSIFFKLVVAFKVWTHTHVFAYCKKYFLIVYFFNSYNSPLRRYYYSQLQMKKWRILTLYNSYNRWQRDIGEQWWIQRLSLWPSEHFALHLWLFCLCIISPHSFPFLKGNPVGKPSDKMTYQDNGL